MTCKRVICYWLNNLDFSQKLRDCPFDSIINMLGISVIFKISIENYIKRGIGLSPPAVFLDAVCLFPVRLKLGTYILKKGSRQRMPKTRCKVKLTSNLALESSLTCTTLEIQHFLLHLNWQGVFHTLFFSTQLLIKRFSIYNPRFLYVIRW